jgi:hypothetical protein
MSHLCPHSKLTGGVFAECSLTSGCVGGGDPVLVNKDRIEVPIVLPQQQLGSAGPVETECASRSVGTQLQ